MDIAIGVKSTKPGSKASSRNSAGRSERVPVGLIHVVDLDAQNAGASFDALCGETMLMRIDGSWDDDWSNERCAECGEQMWVASFSQMQDDLLD